MLRIAVVCLLCGCVTGPLNGSVEPGPIRGKALTVEGFYPKPGINITIDVLASSAADPQVEANWAHLATVSSSTSPATYNGDSLYYFTANVVPVAGFTRYEAARWPNGKLLRLRAIAHDPSGDQPLHIFDDATFSDCAAANSTLHWYDLGQACQSPFAPLAVVSPLNNPADLGKGVNTYDYLGRKLESTTVETQLYYSSVNAPKTLAAFKARYGFGANDVTATYYNAGDLGIGREMHCVLTAAVFPGVACYVANYGVDAQGNPDFGGDPTKALNDAAAHANAFATVAMVYDAPNVANATKFFVYDKQGNLQLQAPLDSTGAHKSIPNNCLACHGIKSSYTHNIAALQFSVSPEARFLPFDPYAYKYSSAAGLTQAAQESSFRKLNALIYGFAPMTPATKEFLLGLYGGKAPTDPTAISNNTFVPAGWAGARDDSTVYTGVVKQSCRTCHISSTDQAIDFSTATQFSANAKALVCDGHGMPHSEQSLRVFWNSGARAYLSQWWRTKAANDCSP